MSDFFPEIQMPKGSIYAQKFMREMVAQKITYRGITASAGAQELFIQNEPNVRLTIPEKSGAVAQWMGMAYNMDSAVGVDGSLFRGVGAFTAERYGAGGGTLGLTVLSGTGFVFSASNVLKSIICTVTPGTTARVLWLLSLEIIALGDGSAPFSASPEYTGIIS